MNNTIILLKAERTLTKREYKDYSKGDSIFGIDSEPKELRRWNIDQEEEAKSELRKYKCQYQHGIDNYFITEYALEYCECDEDGEFIGGSDYDLAEEVAKS